MSHYIDYDDPETWAKVRKAECLSDDSSKGELRKSLGNALHDIEAWQNAEDLQDFFGITRDPNLAGDGYFYITEFDWHRRLAEFHTTAAAIQKRLGCDSEIDKNNEACAAITAALDADERIDRRGAIEATRAKGSLTN